MSTKNQGLYKLTIADIWDALLKAHFEDKPLLLKLASLDEADSVRRAISVYKSRTLSKSGVDDILDKFRLKFTVSPHGNNVVLRIDTAADSPATVNAQIIEEG